MRALISMAGSTLLALALAVVQPAAPDRGPRNVLDYGADPTGQRDSYEAFERACNDWQPVKGQNRYAGGAVYVPRGVYRLSQPLHLLRSIKLTGDGPFATVLDCQGIVTHNWKTAAAEGMEGASQYSLIEDMTLRGGSEHGIDMRAGIAVCNVHVEGFGGNGINIHTDDQNRNANRFYLERVVASKNKNGFYAKGDDSNAGTLVNCDARSNREWGVWEQSFLGNCYVGLHVGYNDVGAINSCRHTAKNAFVNCYQEGSNKTHPIVMTAGDTVLGGISFQYEEIAEHIDERGRSGGRPVVINQVCSPLPIRGDGHEVTIGGSDILAFRPTGSQMYRLRFDDRRKVLMFSYANSPAMSIEFAAEGHPTAKPMTLLRVNQ